MIAVPLFWRGHFFLYLVQQGVVEHFFQRELFCFGCRFGAKIDD